MGDRENILKIFSNCIFDGVLTSEDIDDKIFSQLPDDFEYDWNEGASKLVIIPKDAKYVIKIPYTGSYHESWDSEQEEVEYYYDEFRNANSTKKHRWDYCFTEVLVWKLAKIEKIQNAFAKETMIGKIDEHPIYIQQRVEIYHHSNKFNSASDKQKKKTLDYCARKNLFALSDEGLSWQADVLEYYGNKQFDKIMKFISNNHIGDLHNGNIGYIGNRPVFCDYSDYFDE